MLDISGDNHIVYRATPSDGIDAWCGLDLETQDAESFDRPLHEMMIHLWEKTGVDRLGMRRCCEDGICNMCEGSASDEEGGCGHSDCGVCGGYSSD